MPELVFHCSPRKRRLYPTPLCWSQPFARTFLFNLCLKVQGHQPVGDFHMQDFAVLRF